MKSRIALIFAFTLACLGAAEKPNILWITSEDNAAHWLGCYGNTQVETPRMDALAAEGSRFTNAYSNAPVCAVARATILNGAYAPTQGTQHMRSRYPIDGKYKPYVHYLKQAGYYCSNNSKTDYNFLGNDQAIWDACSGKAHYKNRADGQPFFAIFNLMVSHESSLFPEKIDRMYKGKVKTRIKPADIMVPPYLPDLPEIRRDLAIYHDTMKRLDDQIGGILDELEKSGLADDTIIFYYADHGGILPRGKRYLKDTGVKIPMIVRVPEKWAHLSPFKAGSTPDELVAFVDLAPTLLSLVGTRTPEQMQGRAFLGKNRKEPAPDASVFLYADRFDEIKGMRRGLTDGRWKYIRRFTPHLPAAPYSFYQFGQAGWNAWQREWKNGSLSEKFNRIWESPQAPEELFDTHNDPWEIHNLAEDPQHAERLNAMRQQLKQRMIDTRDSSLVPEAMIESLAKNQPVSKTINARSKEWTALVDLAFTASSGNPDALPGLTTMLKSSDPLTRYWAAHAFMVLGEAASPAKNALMRLAKDPEAAIRITAAHALHRMGHASADLLVKELNNGSSTAAKLSAINAIKTLDVTDQVPPAVLKRLASSPHAYVKRFAEELDR